MSLSKVRLFFPLVSKSGRQAFSSATKTAQINNGGYKKVAAAMGFGTLGGWVGVALQSKDLSIKTSFVDYISDYISPAVYAKSKDDCVVTAKGKAVKTGGCMTGNNPGGSGSVQKDCMMPKKTCCNSQCNIIAPPTMYSLYLWISLDHTANPRQVAKIAADMECLVDSVTTPCDDACEQMIAGVGFGPNFYSQIMGKTCRNFYYTHRKGQNGELPATAGDIFLHAKCNNMGKLFDLCKNYICSFPEGSISEFEDIYG